MDWLMRWHEHLGDRLPCARWCRLTADKQRAASAHAGSRLPSSRGVATLCCFLRTLANQRTLNRRRRQASQRAWHVGASCAPEWARIDTH
jgi:hypothetical protein